MTVYSDIKEVIKLLDSVKTLQETTKELADIVNSIDQRLIRLEERFDGVEERVKTAASSAAAVVATLTFPPISGPLRTVIFHL